MIRLFETGQKIVLDDVLKDALENVLKSVPKDTLQPLQNRPISLLLKKMRLIKKIMQIIFA